jgi:alginate O-acetyltransferase complex protein AlgI
MRFDSIHFLVFSIIAVILLRIFVTEKNRDWAICAINIYFIASFINKPELELILPLAIFLIIGYLGIVAAKALGSTNAVIILLAVVIILFAWLKQYSIITPILPAIWPDYLTVGLSYILFRVIHLIIDVADGAAPLPGPLAYLNFPCSF